jgi:hypothetical protein
VMSSETIVMVDEQNRFGVTYLESQNHRH